MIVFGFLMRSADRTIDQEQERQLLKSVVASTKKKGKSENRDAEDEEVSIFESQTI